MSVTALFHEGDIEQRPDDGPELLSGTCRQHGSFEVAAIWLMGKLRNEQPTCPHCMTLAVEADERHEKREADARRKRLAERRIRETGIPLRVIDAPSFVPPNKLAAEHLKTVREYGEQFDSHQANGSSLVMCGKPGTGKTHLACKLGLYLSGRGASVRYATATGLMRYVRGAYGDGADYTESQAIERYTGVDLLILDELGVKLATDHDRAVLFEIIDQRYQNQLPSVVISNLAANELGEATDERMIDRLRHSGTVLVFDWESYRGAAS